MNDQPERRVHRKRTEPLPDRKCKNCFTMFTPKRIDASTCSYACQEAMKHKFTMRIGGDKLKMQLAYGDEGY